MLIRFILALYILGLSVYPCSDQAACIDEGETVIVSDTKSHNHSNAEEDVCSPFCICSCCATHIQLNHPADLTFVNLIHNTNFVSSYQEKPTLDGTKFIWQPPKA